jgi:hypothetical protein
MKKWAMVDSQGALICIVFGCLDAQQVLESRD